MWPGGGGGGGENAPPTILALANADKQKICAVNFEYFRIVRHFPNIIFYAGAFSLLRLETFKMVKIIGPIGGPYPCTLGPNGRGPI